MKWCDSDPLESLWVGGGIISFCFSRVLIKDLQRKILLLNSADSDDYQICVLSRFLNFNHDLYQKYLKGRKLKNKKLIFFLSLFGMNSFLKDIRFSHFYKKIKIYSIKTKYVPTYSDFT